MIYLIEVRIFFNYETLSLPNANDHLQVHWRCHWKRSKIQSFFKALLFRVVLCSQQYWAEVRDFPYTPNTHTDTTSIYRPPLVTVDEPTLTRPNHSNSMHHFIVQIYCCTFYEFGQMCNNIYPSLRYHTEYFQCPKNPLCSTYSSFPRPKAWQPSILLLLP